jgi:hypothetical protein
MTSTCCWDLYTILVIPRFGCCHNFLVNLTYILSQSFVRRAKLGYLNSAGNTTGRLLALANASIACACVSVRIVVPMDMKKLFGQLVCTSYVVFDSIAYPKVAAEPAMYCPNVRIIPLGPGPNRMMFVAPNIKPIMRPTAVVRG